MRSCMRFGRYSSRVVVAMYCLLSTRIHAYAAQDGRICDSGALEAREHKQLEMTTYAQARLSCLLRRRRRYTCWQARAGTALGNIRTTRQIWPCTFPSEAAHIDLIVIHLFAHLQTAGDGNLEVCFLFAYALLLPRMVRALILATFHS